MPASVNHQLVAKHVRGHAQRLRGDWTEAEAAMWRLLRDRRLLKTKFRRQVPFRNYILDFVCFERRVVVEIDGSQRADSERDKTRDALLASEGFQVIRYWNNDVLQRRQAVMEDLFSRLELDAPEPLARRAARATLSHKGRG